MSIIVSIIIPCRNEEHFITPFLESLNNQDYDFEKMEVLIGDGQSSDQTLEKIKKFAISAPFSIHVEDNPEKTVPYALNRLIKKSKGEYIIRMDVHAIYPSDYISMLIQQVKYLNCENVGGQVITKPANESVLAQSIAACSSHKFGVGNSQFRTLNDTQNEPIEVDTVPFGCFPRSIFDKVGFFDTDLTRNQDDEFNARIIKNGGKIMLIPSVKIDYFARKNWSKMRAMFYQYGLFKPLTNKKLGQVSTLRQLVPPLFVAYVLLAWLPVFIWFSWIFIYLSGITLYALVNAYFSFNSKGSILHKLINLLTFPQIHWSYGWGYFSGIFRFIIRNKTTNKKLKQNS